MRECRALLRALTGLREGADGASASAPLRARAIWPNVLTLECVVASVEFNYRQFSAAGSVLVYVATVAFEEILDARITSEELRADT